VRFLADTGVSLRVVAWLREQGRDARHLRGENLHRLPNGEIFQKALAEERIILTFDLDFAEIAALSGGKAASVIVNSMELEPVFCSYPPTPDIDCASNGPW
jgi:predicted nuclease of predicted toxin-antitoxin system